MKRALIALPIVAGLLLPVSAEGAAPKSKAHTLYMHGQTALGEQDGVEWISQIFPAESPLTLDAKKPTATDSKSMFYNGVVNDVCTGVPMYPTFVAKIDGTIDSAISLNLHSLSLPGTYTVRAWTDTAIFQCNAEFVDPAAQGTFTLPAGKSEVKVVMPKMLQRKRSPRKSLTVMIYAPQAPEYRGQVGRLYYDAASTPSSISFLCTPRAGRSSCLK